MSVVKESHSNYILGNQIEANVLQLVRLTFSLKNSCSTLRFLAFVSLQSVTVDRSIMSLKCIIQQSRKYISTSHCVAGQSLLVLLYDGAHSDQNSICTVLDPGTSCEFCQKFCQHQINSTRQLALAKKSKCWRNSGGLSQQHKWRETRNILGRDSSSD